MRTTERTSVFNAKAQLESIKQYIGGDSGYAEVYVGTYAKYNNGSLFGAWIDLSTVDDYEEFQEVCHKLHSDEEDPEFMIQDYQGFPRQFYGEWMDEDDFDKAKEFGEMDEDKQEAVEAYMSCTGNDNWDGFEMCYQGKYDSEEDYAEEFVSQVYPEVENSRLGIYLDYEKFARDLFLDGCHFEDGHVFAFC